MTVAVIAVLTASALRPASIEVINSTSAVTGSPVSWSRHPPQRGRPCRSLNVTWRSWPQAAQISGRQKHGEQYQLSPRSCIKVISRPQPAHCGAAIALLPAARRAKRRSPTTLGAGACPVMSTDGFSDSASASRRRLARPPLISSTIWRTVTCPRDGSVAMTKAVTAPIGSRSGSDALT